jgi:O-antigen/teichoic acid export membrane protein
MSVKRNVVASLASQGYATAANIVALPLYLKAMGAEAYGLVGFYAVMQTWFAVLDAGLTAMVGRETTRYLAGATDALSYRRIVRAVEGIFGAVALFGCAILFSLAGLIGRRWLVVKELSALEVTRALELIALLIGSRWMTGFYRGAVSGAERIVWLSIFNAAVTTVRIAGVLLLFAFGWTRVTNFFAFQLVASAFELSILIAKTYRILPAAPGGQSVPWSWAPLRPVLTFSLMGGLATFAGVVSGQADEMVLSKILPLAEFGYFSLAVSAAGGVAVLGGPVQSALLPRLTWLEAEGKREAFLELYRQATQFVAVFAGAAAITLAFCAGPIMLAWTGNGLLAGRVAPVVRLYALANGVVAVGGFQYSLQYARGNLRLHALGSFVYPALFVPAFIWAGSRYGAIGAGYVFLAVNVASFALWVSFVQARFEPGLNAKWYTQDTLFIFAVMAVVGYLAHTAFPSYTDRARIALSVLVFGVVVSAAGVGASSMAWRKVNEWRLLRTRKASFPSSSA